MTLLRRTFLPSTGDLLVAEQIISDDLLQLALQQQRQSGRKLGATLVDMGFLSEEQLLQFLAQQLDVGLGGRMQPHVVVHRRAHGQRRLRRRGGRRRRRPGRG